MKKVRISTKCSETWPCRHMVIIDDGKQKRKKEMNGKQIEKMLRKNHETHSKDMLISNNTIPNEYYIQFNCLRLDLKQCF